MPLGQRNIGGEKKPLTPRQDEKPVRVAIPRERNTPQAPRHTGAGSTMASRRSIRREARVVSQ
jgi:hypothetical protein